MPKQSKEVSEVWGIRPAPLVNFCGIFVYLRECYTFMARLLQPKPEAAYPGELLYESHSFSQTLILVLDPPT